MSTYHLVDEFHQKFGVPHGDPKHPTLDFERVRLRFDLIAEEFCELIAALYGENTAEDVRADIAGAIWFAQRIEDMDPRTGDIVEVADALGDLEVVINGFALEAGIPLPSVIAEIHRSNMSKLGADGEPILREDGKILKGPNYTEPDIEGVLDGTVYA